MATSLRVSMSMIKEMSELQRLGDVQDDNLIRPIPSLTSCRYLYYQLRSDFARFSSFPIVHCINWWRGF